MSHGHRSYLVGLVGAGVGPSLTPALHEHEAQRHGLAYVYRTIDLTEPGWTPDDVGTVIATARRMGFDALNVTHPCKQTAPKHLDRLSPEAELLGSVNTVLLGQHGTIGHNTDVSGFARSFARGLPGVDIDTVVLVGAGGAGAGVAHALLTAGTGRLLIVDTDTARARTLTTTLRTRFGDDRVAAADQRDLPALLTGADGLVNSTPVGMSGNPGVPLPVEALDRRTWVADVIYRPARTTLLRLAAERGCPTLAGTGMAVFQAADTFRLITGEEPDPERMLADMDTLLAFPGQPSVRAWEADRP